jgi:WD40 repeat protein
MELVQLNIGAMASCGYDCAIKLWDLDLQVCTLTINGHQKAINSLIDLKQTSAVSKLSV